MELTTKLISTDDGLQAMPLVTMVALSIGNYFS